MLLTESSVPSEETRTCPECGRATPRSVWRKRKWGKVCNPCWKRAQRAQGGQDAPWLEHDREASRRWKEENRERNRARDREQKRAKRQAAA